MELFELRERIQDAVDNPKEAKAILSEVDEVISELEDLFSAAINSRNESESMLLVTKMKYYFKMREDLQQMVH